VRGTLVYILGQIDRLGLRDRATPEAQEDGYRTLLGVGQERLRPVIEAMGRDEALMNCLSDLDEVTGSPVGPGTAERLDQVLVDLQQAITNCPEVREELAKLTTGVAKQLKALAENKSTESKLLTNFSDEFNSEEVQRLLVTDRLEFARRMLQKVLIPVIRSTLTAIHIKPIHYEKGANVLDMTDMKLIVNGLPPTIGVRMATEFEVGLDENNANSGTNLMKNMRLVFDLRLDDVDITLRDIAFTLKRTSWPTYTASGHMSVEEAALGMQVSMAVDQFDQAFSNNPNPVPAPTPSPAASPAAATASTATVDTTEPAASRSTLLTYLERRRPSLPLADRPLIPPLAALEEEGKAAGVASGEDEEEEEDEDEVDWGEVGDTKRIRKRDRARKAFGKVMLKASKSKDALNRVLTKEAINPNSRNSTPAVSPKVGPMPSPELSGKQGKVPVAAPVPTAEKPAAKGKDLRLCSPSV
jgi:hypothetical protein